MGLGVGRTQHCAPVEDGAVGRKGISVERTFAALSTPGELEAKVRLGTSLTVRESMHTQKTSVHRHVVICV